MMRSNRRDHLRGLAGLGLGLSPLGGCERADEPPRDAGHHAGRPASLPSAGRLLPTPAVVDGDDDFREPSCVAPTEPNIEGPFYKGGAPVRSVLAQGEEGQPLLLEGRVFVAGPTCRPMSCVLHVWHADHRGRYDLDG